MRELTGKDPPDFRDPTQVQDSQAITDKPAAQIDGLIERPNAQCHSTRKEAPMQEASLFEGTKGPPCPHVQIVSQIMSITNRPRKAMEPGSNSGWTRSRTGKQGTIPDLGQKKRITQRRPSLQPRPGPLEMDRRLDRNIRCLFC